jgi:hypothetical protein
MDLWLCGTGPLPFSNTQFSLESLDNPEAYQTAGFPSVVMSFKIGAEEVTLAAKSPTVFSRMRTNTRELCTISSRGFVTIRRMDLWLR